jgi:hypothetical protein
MKRKAGFDAAKTNNKTSTESMSHDEVTAQYAGGEDMIRGANRNSQQGRQGES